MSLLFPCWSSAYLLYPLLKVWYLILHLLFLHFPLFSLAKVLSTLLIFSKNELFFPFNCVKFFFMYFGVLLIGTYIVTIFVVLMNWPCYCYKMSFFILSNHFYHNIYFVQYYFCHWLCWRIFFRCVTFQPTFLFEFKMCLL